MKILWVFIILLMPLTSVIAREYSKEIQVCEISNKYIGRFFNRCPFGAVVEEVDVRISGQPPYSYFTTVMVNCVKQTVVCSKKKD